MKVDPWQGTAGGYSNHKCRCPLCRQAWVAYMTRVRESRWKRGLCIECPNASSRSHVRCQECRRKIEARRKQAEARPIGTEAI